MNIVNQIVELILSFIVDFFDKLRLTELSEALRAKKKVTDSKVTETDKLYEEYKNDYEAYKTDMANRALPDPGHIDDFGHANPSGSDVRPSPGKVQPSSSEAARDNQNANRRKGRSIQPHRRSKRYNRKAKQRK